MPTVGSATAQIPADVGVVRLPGGLRLAHPRPGPGRALGPALRGPSCGSPGRCSLVDRRSRASLIAATSGAFLRQHPLDVAAVVLPVLRPLRLLRLLTLLDVLNRYAGSSLRGRVGIYLAGSVSLIVFMARSRSWTPSGEAAARSRPSATPCGGP